MRQQRTRYAMSMVSARTGLDTEWDNIRKILYIV